MGNSQLTAIHELTPENLDLCQRRVLKFAAVSDDQIVIKDVKVGEDHNSEPITIRTMLCGDPNKPTLVYCHGYGGSGALFFNLIKSLITKFYVIYIDMPG